ncbi:lon protease-like [Triplophysa rosa]|uniref:lon protease-like n=1 Tax=Triplophysa rosa TaxID=992332 RepID=UPI002545DD6C|nr:lon protease-like [Triplophysa rosa]
MKEYYLVDKNANADLITNLENTKEVNKIIVFIAQQLNLDNEKQQEIINTQCIAERIELIIQFIKDEIEIVKAESKIRNIVRDQIEKRQKDIYLNEQLQAIHKELGTDKTNSEFEKIEKKLNQIKMPKETKDSMYEYLSKLQMMNPISAEATVLLNYLHVICSLPWNKNKKIKINLERTEKILEESHFGLDKIKERILEYLAVQKHTNNKLAGPIICLIGPPGVGKTSLGKSIADSMDREFISIPLGGVSDEAEIRGHRRTYIGAMPGRIIQKLSKLKYNNPVVVLDEIDKISSDFRGDPSSALLQVLDPEQNKKFLDNYLDVDYDLSQVMFICTANTLNMSTPLIDRMEIIRLSSYTQEEKFEIAKKHLITKNMESHNLTKKEIKISDGAIKNLIKHYTQEAGVRNLEREIAKLCRKATKKIINIEEHNKNNKLNKEEFKTIEITDKNLEEFLGVKKFLNEEASKKNEIGLATGLAWTEER